MKLPGRSKKQSPTLKQRLDGRRREATLLASGAVALLLSAGAWRKLRASNRPAAEPAPPAASQPADTPPAAAEDGDAGGGDAASPADGEGDSAAATDAE